MHDTRKAAPLRFARKKSFCACVNLRRAAQAVTAYYDRVLSPAGITINQFSLLRNLRRAGPCSVSELAAWMGLERSTLVRNLKPLLDSGCVADGSKPGSRNRSISVTPAGEKILKAALPLWNTAQEGVRKEIGAAKVRELTKLLSALEGL